MLAALGVNGILGARLATGLVGEPDLNIPDDQYLGIFAGWAFSAVIAWGPT